MAMTTLVVGASGATGQLLVGELLARGQQVRIIVRSPENLPHSILNHDKLAVIQATVLDMSDAEMVKHVHGCDAVASCLGHNLSFMANLIGDDDIWAAWKGKMPVIYNLYFII